MKCNNCGTNNPDGATFCNGCGAPLITGTQNQTMLQNNQAMPQYNNQAIPQQNYTQPKQTKPKKKKHPIVALIIIVAILAIIAGGFAPGLIKYHKNSEKEKTVNAGKGADNPVEIAQAYMMCLNYETTTYMNNYLDENNNNDILITNLENAIVDVREQGFSNINLDGVKYQTSVEYIEDGNICVDVYVDFAEKGLLGGNTIIGNKDSWVLYMHKADTPQGEKWFLGK